MGFGWFKKQEKKDVLDLRWNLKNTKEKITESIPLLTAEDCEKKMKQAKACAAGMEFYEPEVEPFVKMEGIVECLIDINSKTGPNTASEYNEQGLALWRKTVNVPDSVFWFHAAAKLEPTRAEPWLNLWLAHRVGASVFGQVGKKDQEEKWRCKAVEFFDKARELNPKLVEATTSSRMQFAPDAGWHF